MIWSVSHIILLQIFFLHVLVDRGAVSAQQIQQPGGRRGALSGDTPGPAGKHGPPLDQGCRPAAPSAN